MAAAASSAGGTWYLSFDCATKTLGYSLFWIGDGACRQSKWFPQEVKFCCQDVVDLAPGRLSHDIGLAERLRLVIDFVKMTITPKLAGFGPLAVIIEYQMKKNQDSLVVCIALATMFSEHHVIFVHPGQKNMVNFVPGNRIANVKKEYKSGQRANKVQAMRNYDFWAKLLNFTPIATSKKEHVADCFTQILGYIQFGGEYGAKRKKKGKCIPPKAESR